jgi:hypothetical protein
MAASRCRAAAIRSSVQVMHLKGRPAPLLDGPSRRFPEVLFESR